MGAMGEMAGHMPRGMPGGLPGLPGGLGGMGMDLSGGMQHPTFTLSGIHGYGDTSDSLLPDGSSTEAMCQVKNEDR